MKAILFSNIDAEIKDKNRGEKHGDKGATTNANNANNANIGANISAITISKETIIGGNIDNTINIADIDGTNSTNIADIGGIIAGAIFGLL